jgi:hypothetical protein
VQEVQEDLFVLKNECLSYLLQLGRRTAVL